MARKNAAELSKYSFARMHVSVIFEKVSPMFLEVGKTIIKGRSLETITATLCERFDWRHLAAELWSRQPQKHVKRCCQHGVAKRAK